MAMQPPVVPAESPARVETRPDSRLDPKPEKRSKGLTFSRVFSTEGVHPFDEIEWEVRSAVINDERGRAVFEQKDIEAPKSWSQTATNIVASKYFRGAMGSKERETSVKQLVGRVVDTIAGWAVKQSYFETSADLAAFKDDLTFLLVRQYAAFNSPVWFNVGIEPHPQASACFINSVSDTMDSILGLARTEGMLFKYGSGTGSNLSSIRSSKENLAGGGTASGPVSFMRGYDAFAGVIKSGGKTRRAAKMVILNADHPDIEEFITSKSEEERKAWALIDAGYNGGFNVKGGAYDSVFFQNANHSVRATDDFMRAVVEDKEWTTHFVRDGAPAETKRARDLMALMAESAWQCGDPGMQFDTTINDWHTCPNTARINASNPCSEYMFLDDTACNLASLNLMRFRQADGSFDVASYEHCCRLWTIVLEISVMMAQFPSRQIAELSYRYRTLGLGFANIGGVLMASGIGYDSAQGRAICGAISAVMTGVAYATSAEMSQELGPFPGYEPNAQDTSFALNQLIRFQSASRVTRSFCTQNFRPSSAMPRETGLFARSF